MSTFTSQVIAGADSSLEALVVKYDGMFRESNVGKTFPNLVELPIYDLMKFLLEKVYIYVSMSTNLSNDTPTEASK